MRLYWIKAQATGTSYVCGHLDSVHEATLTYTCRRSFLEKYFVSWKEGPLDAAVYFSPLCADLESLPMLSLFLSYLLKPLFLCSCREECVGKNFEKNVWCLTRHFRFWVYVISVRYSRTGPKTISQKTFFIIKNYPHNCIFLPCLWKGQLCLL